MNLDDYDDLNDEMPIEVSDPFGVKFFRRLASFLIFRLAVWETIGA